MVASLGRVMVRAGSCLPSVATASTAGGRRAVMATARRFASEQPANPLLETTKKPPSRIRAVFFGFLAGVTASCGIAYGMLTEDIEKSASTLQQSVSSLGQQVFKISDALSKVEDLEQQVQVLRAKAASHSQLTTLAEQVQQQKDELAMTLSQHKAAVWEAQEEMFKSIQRLEAMAPDSQPQKTGGTAKNDK